jgi:2'-5' RNA ligase
MEQIKKEEMNEAKQTYDYGCAMIYFDFKEITDLQATIATEDLYTEDNDQSYGLEHEPHCTLLYGLHSEVTVEQVKAQLAGIEFKPMKLHNPSLFENEKFDVLKLDVQPVENLQFLKQANKALTQLPHTTSFPDYYPHCTIAYLKPGQGQKYIKDKSKHWIVQPLKIVYSQPDGAKPEWKV